MRRWQLRREYGSAGGRKHVVPRPPAIVTPRRRYSAFGVVGDALPVDHHARLVADDPRVVPRRTHHEIARPELELFAVVHANRHPAADEIPHVRRLAAIGPGNGLDVLRPLPARLESRAAYGRAPQAHKIGTALVVLEWPGFFRRIDALASHGSHKRPPCRDVSREYAPSGPAASEVDRHRPLGPAEPKGAESRQGRWGW